MDKEQSQARYDPRLLSEDVSGYHSQSGNIGASSCYNANVRYLHGQKISRVDPCEICLCVDGEIFCWWKKCEHHLRKPPKKPKHHNHRKQQNAWLKGIPQSVVNFPQHLPTHLLNENVDVEAQNNNTVISTKISASPISVINAMDDSPSSTIPENIFNANDTNEPNEHQTSNDMNDKLRIITANPIIIDNKITVEARNSNDEKGYYEKTIINKNGVFIENIRKIANVADENTLNDDVENENINRKRIELMNVPLSQHYVITSSGKIEKTDTLASDDVIAQFRDGLNDFQTSPKPVISSTIGVTGAQTTELNDGPKATTTTTTAAINAHSECIVMGKTYKVGTILPQETGNCLQCVCTQGSDSEGPRVTCSPHNCPPLILPDLFDATGY
ncbi:uncharacterized protein LOC119079508 isoform X2 [Bradysia coprophila]|nr:uncharacterized protein LOC119079508 isoform X2 [Bradysia coprophila]